MAGKQRKKVVLLSWCRILVFIVLGIGGMKAFPLAVAQAAEVIIFADIHLNPVMDIIAGISETLSVPAPIYAHTIVGKRLLEIAEENNAHTVIALGRNAVDEAMTLPPSISVIYDLVVIPPTIPRPNTTGMYMGTPIREYVNMIQKYLPAVHRVSVVCSQEVAKVLGGAATSRVKIYNAADSVDFISAIRQIDADALLLLPDATVLSSTVIEEAYLFSFRNRVPLLGISENHVRHGSLFALVFDPLVVGRHLGEMAQQSLTGLDVGKIPPTPSSSFELYVNTATAKKMGIDIPAEMLSMAKIVY